MSSKEYNVSPPHCYSQHICTEIYVTLLTIDPKPHCTPHTIYLPASQRTPPYPGGQAQTNLFTRSLHEPPFWHGLLAHSFISESQVQVTVSHYYGQFSLSMAEESPYIFSKFNLLNTETPLIRILSMPPQCLYNERGLTVLRSRSVQKIKTESRQGCPNALTEGGGGEEGEYIFAGMCRWPLRAPTPL